MPIYEFQCPKCDHEFEELLASSENEHLFCPICHGQAVKVMSMSNFKIGGNYTAANGYSIVSGEK